MEFRDGSGISWTICKQSAPRFRQTSTPTPHHSIFTGWMLFLTPNQQCQSSEGIKSAVYNEMLTTARRRVVVSDVSLNRKIVMIICRRHVDQMFMWCTDVGLKRTKRNVNKFALFEIRLQK